MWILFLQAMTIGLTIIGVALFVYAIKLYKEIVANERNNR